MTREMIIEELQNRGYNAEATFSIKNGVKFEGIRIKNSTDLAPVIYTEGLIKIAEFANKTIEDVVTAVLDMYEEYKSFSFDVKCLEDRDYVLDRLFIALQKESSEKLIKESCELDGIESYLFIKDESEGFSKIKITEAVLNLSGISESEAWEKARENTFKETDIMNISEAVLGFGCDEADMFPLWIVSNKSKVDGASGILNKKALSEFGKRLKTDKFVVLPSSVHECLILPYEEGIDIDDLTDMVRFVNCTEIEPEDQLSDRAYVITL